MALEVFVKKVAFDEMNTSPVVILSDMTGAISIPIYIGLMEAFAIAVKLDGISMARPLTHDLFKNMLEQLGAKPKSVEIVKLESSVYYANIVIVDDKKNKEIFIDARPSDAIALALRCSIPIYINEEIIDETNTLVSIDSLQGFWKTFMEIDESSKKE